MQHSFQIRAHFVHRCVERQLRGRPVHTGHSAVRLHTDDIVAVQCAFVHTGGGNPNIALLVHNGEVAAGGGGHSFVVDPLHKHNQLIRRMDVIDIHKIDLLFSVSMIICHCASTVSFATRTARLLPYRKGTVFTKT